MERVELPRRILISREHSPDQYVYCLTRVDMIIMKKHGRISLIIIALAVVLGCRTGSEDENLEWTAAELEGNYSFLSEGDTITLQLKVKGDSLSGPLIYSFSEKDKNQGVFQGVIQDSLLMGTYRFQSEGVYSSRETVFGILPEGLIEGFGEIEHHDSMAVFVDPYDLRFDHGMLLEKK